MQLNVRRGTRYVLALDAPALDANTLRALRTTCARMGLTVDVFTTPTRTIPRGDAERALARERLALTVPYARTRRALADTSVEPPTRTRAQDALARAIARLTPEQARALLAQLAAAR